MKNFNTKIDKNINNLEKYIGSFGLGQRNTRGDMLFNFAESLTLYIMNSFFQKKDKRTWTWISLNGEVKNEIDYILSTHRHIVQVVEVLDQFLTGCYHRLVRLKLKINTKLERRRKFIRNQSKTLDLDILQERISEYQLEGKRYLKKTIKHAQKKNWLKL